MKNACFRSFSAGRVACVAVFSMGCAGHGDPTAASGAGGASGVLPVPAAGSAGLAGTPADALPCGVAAIVQANCAPCHSPPLDFGVPMPLLTAADFRRSALSDPSRTVASLVAERIANDAKPMPPPPKTRLSAGDAATLTAWIRAGAAGDPSGCAVTPRSVPSAGPPPAPSSVATPPSATATAAPSSGPGVTTPPAPTAAPTTTPTSMPEPPPANPGEAVTCYDFTSHGASAAGDTSAFMIPTGESYRCFYFDVPWAASAVASAFRSKLDNTQGLHHWFLYAMPTAHANGSSEACLPLHFDGPQMVAGWSPGAHDITLPADVGAELPKPMTTVMVEWHYLNATSAPLADRSTVSVCTVPASGRSKLASVTWVGTETLSIPPNAQASFSGTCKPGRKGMGANDPIQLLYAAPHMHQYGRHFALEIDRIDGSKTMAMDQAFDVGNQAMVETPFQLLPGDTLKTTCTFQNTSASAVGWGDPFTGGEMCYGFVFHYPAHALDNGTRSLLGASNSCL